MNKNALPLFFFRIMLISVTAFLRNDLSKENAWRDWSSSLKIKWHGNKISWPLAIRLLRRILCFFLKDEIRILKLIVCSQNDKLKNHNWNMSTIEPGGTLCPLPVSLKEPMTTIKMIMSSMGPPSPGLYPLFNASLLTWGITFSRDPPPRSIVKPLTRLGYSCLGVSGSVFLWVGYGLGWYWRG